MSRAGNFLYPHGRSTHLSLPNYYYYFSFPLVSSCGVPLWGYNDLRNWGATAATDSPSFFSHVLKIMEFGGGGVIGPSRDNKASWNSMAFSQKKKDVFIFKN